MDVIGSANIPILGVCLGHQGIASFYNASVKHGQEPMHGRVSTIIHSDQEGLFEKIPLEFAGVRYHSLVVDKKDLSDSLQVIAKTEDDVIMAIKHRSRPLWGLQFHPEVRASLSKSLFS